MFRTKNLIFITAFFAGAVAATQLKAMNTITDTTRDNLKHACLSQHLVLAQYIFEPLNQDTSWNILKFLNSLLVQAQIKFKRSEWSINNTQPLCNNPSESYLSLITKIRTSNPRNVTLYLLSMINPEKLKNAFLTAFELDDFDNGLIILAAAQNMSHALHDDLSTWALLDCSKKTAPYKTFTALDFALCARDIKSVSALLQAAEPNSHLLIQQSSIAHLFLVNGQDHVEIWNLLQKAFNRGAEHCHSVPIMNAEPADQDHDDNPVIDIDHPEHNHDDINHADQKLLKRLQKKLRNLVLALPRWKKS